ncbi:methyltransferase [Falsiroseomonas sp. HW251]|uniref:methyltransferase n=1 Tax=Falsiroseomonas sp. HW251 TaxID=3390998 RepID=UPI003D311007
MDSPDSDRAALDRLLRGFIVSRLLRTAAELHLADRVPAEGTTTVAALAEEAGVQPGQLRRVLRVLASAGVFALTAGDEVAHSAMSRLLRSDAPNSLHHAARFWTARGSWRAWEEAEAALTGGVPHEAAWGMGRFAWLRAHPEEARIFDAMMANFPDNRHAAVAASYDFAAVRVICDVGGGNGAALRHILARFEGPRGILLDLPDVLAAIPADQLLDGRIEPRPGSFLDAVPAGADLYLVVRVLHDWGDEDCRRILRNIHAAAEAGSRLLVVEQLLDPDPSRSASTSCLVDAQMMVMFGEARERSAEEFAGLLSEAGFALRRVLPTGSPVSILEAEAVLAQSSTIGSGATKSPSVQPR